MKEKEGVLQGNDPNLATLQSMMNVDIVVSKSGDICIFHDKAFSDRVEYAEFNVDTSELSFILRWGMVQSLGEKIPSKFCGNFEEAKYIYAVLGRLGKVEDMFCVPLLCR